VSRTDQRRAATFASYQRDVRRDVSEVSRDARGVSGEAGAEALAPFARELAEGVEANRSELDRLISDNAVGWELDRIAPLERAILRTALYEILYRPDIPDEVAIDEAVETAKIYCGTDAPGFVNGILGGVMKRLSGGDRRSA
jgi:transcription antitermination protein NusB